MSLETLLHEIYAGPSGPEIGAFFDYDGTVITGFSASSFYGHRIRGGEMGLGELAHTLWAGVRGVNTAEDYRELLDLSCQAWAGKTQQALGDLGRRLFKDSIAGRLHLEVWELVKAHHDMGHTVVLASSATAFPGRADGRRPRCAAPPVHRSRGRGRRPDRARHRHALVGPARPTL